MAQTLESLSRRTDTMTGIRGIVHTMKTLSAINALPYERAARGIEAYHQTILDGLGAFMHRNGKLDLTSDRPVTEVIVVFGTDHGLCGSYNETLAAEVSAHLGKAAREDMRLLCVGAQMNDALAGLGIFADQVLLPPASPDGIGRMAGGIVALLDDYRRASATHDIAAGLAYTRRKDHVGHVPVVEPLLPLASTLIAQIAERPWSSRSLPDFTMSAPELLASLIRGHIFSSVFRASAEALVTENATRLATMQQAERSIDDRLEALKADTRSVRQTEITTELLDVIIGFEALKARPKKSGATKRTKDGRPAAAR